MPDNIIELSSRRPAPGDEWLFDIRVFRTPRGRAFAYLGQVQISQIETDETPAERLRRMAKLALEASANLLAVADSMET